MSESSFFKIFNLLEKKEIRLFQRYMSFMYEDQKMALQVLDYCVNHPAKGGGNKHVEMDQIYFRIFGRPFDEDKNDRKNFLNTLSDLHLWLKEFLMNEMLRKDKFSRDLVWILTVMEDKRLSEESIKLRKLKLQAAKEPRTSSFDYLRGMVANYILLQKEKPFLNIDVVQQFSTDIDNYYLLLKIKTACEIANSQKLNPQQLNGALPDTLVSMIQAIPVVRQPLLHIYLEVYHLLTHEPDEAYDKITGLLVFFYNRLPAGETHLILRYLLNFASRKVKEGVDAYWSKSHDLNKFILNKAPDIYETLTSGQYLNIISASIQEKDFDWAENFMHEQGPFLPAHEISEAMLLAKAIIVFGKKDFTTAKELLSNAKFSLILNEIRAKIYLLMVEFELKGDPDILLSDCIKFELFLLRHNSTYQKIIQPFRSFAKILKMLIKCKDPKEVLIKKLEADIQVASRLWLTEKVETYQQKFSRGTR